MSKYKNKHKGKCERCGTSFLGRFGQKYCSPQCRAANWYTLKNAGSKRLHVFTKPADAIPVEVNGKGLQSCPYCKGQLYTPAAQPYIIKCENININCPKGYWRTPEI